MFAFRLLAATGDAIAQLDSLGGETVNVSLNLEGRGVTRRPGRHVCGRGSPFWLGRERSWGEDRP
jgi:hypothetical protein